jgi:hypothetical protein
MDGPEILKSVDQVEKLNKVARRTFGLEGIQPEIGLTLNMLLAVGQSQAQQDTP